MSLVFGGRTFQQAFAVQPNQVRKRQRIGDVVESTLTF